MPYFPNPGAPRRPTEANDDSPKHGTDAQAIHANRGGAIWRIAAGGLVLAGAGAIDRPAQKTHGLEGGKYSGGDPNIDRRPAPRDIGRVQLQNSPGSVGFDSKPSNIGKFGDGRTVPG